MEALQRDSSVKRSIYDFIMKYYTQIAYAATAIIAIWVAGFGSMSDMNQRAGLVTLLVPTVFVIKPLTIGKEKKTYWWTKAIDVILVIATIAGGVYMLYAWPSKMLKSSAFTKTDIMMDHAGLRAGSNKAVRGLGGLANGDPVPAVYALRLHL